MITPGPLSREQAAELNELIRKSQVSNALPSPYLGVNPSNYRGGNYTDNETPNPIFPVLLTAYDSGTGAYSWSQAISTGFGYAGWQAMAGGLSGTATVQPAFEPNDVVIDVTDEPVAWIQRAYRDTSLGWVYTIVAVGEGSGGGGFAASGMQAVFNSSTGDIASSTQTSTTLVASVYSFGPNPMTLGSNYIQVPVAGYYLVQVELEANFAAWNYPTGYPTGGEVVISMGSSGAATNIIAQSCTVPLFVAGYSGYGYGTASGVLNLGANASVSAYINNRTDKPMLESYGYGGSITVTQLA